MKNYIYAQFEDDKPKEVSMLLYGEISHIGGENKVNAHAFANEMFFLHEMGYKITVRINSEGGDVLRGLSIVDAVIATEADTLVVGMAASMAGVIHQSGKRRKMYDFASIMIHAASGGDKDLHSIVSAQLGTLLNSKSSLGEERIAKILSGKNNVWFAVQGVPDDRNAEKMGLVDEIVYTGKQIPINISENEKNDANLFSIYAKMIGNNKKPQSKMENVLLKAHLKVSDSATDNEMIAKVDELVNKAVEPKNQEIETLKNELSELKDARTNELIADAKNAGYPEASLDSLKSFAKNDFEGAKNTIEAFKAVKVVTPTAPVASFVGGGSTQSEEKNYSYYQNNPEAWNALTDEEKLKIVE